jgi:nucleotide-binding universal stress UspA family protein
MKKIAVLIDFTEGSKVALIQAAALAKKTNAKICGLHIVSALNKVSDATVELDQFLKDYAVGVASESLVDVGSLNTAVHDGLKKIEPDLVVVCTHGVKGMFQTLFGAHILKLVQSIPYPCIVIHEKSNVDLASTKKILFPIGPHPEFMTKIKQVSAFAKALNATVVIYEIDRPAGEYEVLLAKNMEHAKTYFDEQGVSYSKVLEEVKVFSVGFSRQTIDYASENGISIIGLMATVSQNEELFGLGDKENFLVNEQGVSVLSCNM